MAPELEAETDLYRIENHSSGAAIFTWESYASGEEFRDGANALLEHIVDNDVTKLVVDSSEIQAHDDDDLEWLQEEWTPQIIDEGVRSTAMVHQDSVISKMDIDGLMEELEDLPYDALVTTSREEALDWIADQ